MRKSTRKKNVRPKNPDSLNKRSKSRVKNINKKNNANNARKRFEPAAHTDDKDSKTRSNEAKHKACNKVKQMVAATPNNN